MAEYSKLITTAKGQALVAKVIAGTASDYDFTRIVASDDEYEITDLESLTSLTEKQSSTIAEKKVVNSVGVQVKAAFTNASLAEGYYMNTLGLYATDPDEGEILFAVCIETTGNCYMPPYTGVTVSGAIVTMTTVVSNSEDVDITVDPAAVATVDMVDDLDVRVTANEADIANLKAFVNYNDDYDIYGVEVDFENKKFTRVGGAVNKQPGTDFDGINAFGGRRRCNLADDGTVNAYEGDQGYVEDGSNGQVMVEQPKFYYKVVPLKTETVGGRVLLRKARYYVSDTEKTGFKLHPAFKMNGAELDKVYVSAYEATSYDVSASAYITNDAQTVDFANDKIASIAGAKPMSGLTQVGATRAGFRAIAAKRGTGWSQSLVQTVTMSELLMLIEYASFNMQAAIGRGDVDKTDDGSTNMAENTGATSPLGNKSGAIRKPSNVELVSYRGEENFWGNIWTWFDGININYGKIFIKDHDFADDTSSGYTDTGITCINANGYVSAFIYDEEFDWLFVAGEVVGSDALPVSDYFWQNVAQAWTVAALGVSWTNASYAGAFCWNLADVSSYRYRSIGGRAVFRKAAA